MNIEASQKERRKRLDLRITPKFKSTNKLWNDLGLNCAWSIGYLTKLFKLFSGNSYEEWEQFYFESGRKRLKQIEQLPIEKKMLLTNFKIHALGNYENMYIVTKEEKDLNAYYGRTNVELKEIGIFMYQQLRQRGNPLGITEDECITYVHIRVLDEIFLGMDREINTVNKLKTFFPQAVFKELPVEIDAKYAVDYEIYVDDELVLAIQIKSNHYRNDNQAILKETKSFNRKKNEAYKKRFGVDVYYVYANEQGYIEDKKTFPIIYSYLSKKERKNKIPPSL